MKIKNEKKKYCKICGKQHCNNGIMIIKSSICEKCIEEITNIDCSNSNYQYIKEQIKTILF